eukprot:2967809-Rhodomonas_salina.1
MWVRGQTLVEIGVDAASRELAQSLHDTQVTEPLWALAQALARQHFDSDLHIDWFTSETLHKCQRFWSQYHSPSGEGADALSAPTWGATACACGSQHSLAG